MNFEKLKSFLTGGELWKLDPDKLRRPEAIALHILRFSQMTARQFKRDNLQLHAASLTFNTLLALVPLFTLGFAVLKGLGYGETFLEKIHQTITTFPDQVRITLERILEAIIQTDFAKLGGIGGLILLFLIIQVLGRIESSINLVWGIEKQRSLMQKMTSYISVTIIVPILIMAAVTINRLFLVEHIPVLPSLFPFISSTLSLTLLYLLFPHTKVRLGPAFASGLLASVLFQIWFKFYALVQPGVTNYNVIYGTLASVPIFLAWLYISWMIVLVGVEFSFALQNYTAFQQEHEIPALSLNSRVNLVLTILIQAAHSLEGEGAPFGISPFSEDHGIPLRYVYAYSRFLENMGLLVETADSNGTFVLLKQPELIPITPVLNAVYYDGASLDETELPEKARNVLAELEEARIKTLSDKTLSDLL